MFDGDGSSLLSLARLLVTASSVVTARDDVVNTFRGQKSHLLDCSDDDFSHFPHGWGRCIANRVRHNIPDRESGEQETRLGGSNYRSSDSPLAKF